MFLGDFLCFFDFLDDFWMIFDDFWPYLRPFSSVCLMVKVFWSSLVLF